MAVLGFTGGLLHVVNHALFKSLLFLGAGSVLHATGTGELDRLGGLLKRMPVTGTTFLIGAAAISGLPPLNGFVSEFLIYLGAIAGLGSQPHDAPAWPLMGVLVVGGLALIGGLAAACFTKAFGIVFLGEPRSERSGPRTRSRRGDAVADGCACRSMRVDRAGGAAVAPGAPAGRGRSFSRRRGMSCRRTRHWGCATGLPLYQRRGRHRVGPLDRRRVRIVHLAGADRAFGRAFGGNCWRAAAWNRRSRGTAATLRPRRACSTRLHRSPGR